MSTISFRQGENGYSGTIDTMLRETDPNTNYATASTLKADSSDVNGSDAQSLLQFSDLFGTDSGQIPLGATITSATLTLQTTNRGDGAELHRMLTSWTDSATWNSFGGGIQADGVEAASSPDVVTGRITERGESTFDVTASVQAWAGGEANHGWAFLPSGDDGWKFTSSEGSFKPVLTVSYTLETPPPPSENTAPVATNDQATTQENTAVKVAVLANDTDANGDALSVSNVADPAHGAAIVNADGTVTYTPDSNFVGQDSFVYTVNDGHGGTDTGSVSIDVTSAPTPPSSPFSGSVSATVETDSLAGSGDVADDPAIWVNQADPSRSVVIGTDKDNSNGGLFVFDLQGNVIDTAASGQAENNVDLRYGFELGGSSVDLIGASNRETGRLDFFTIDPVTRELDPAGSVDTGLSNIYGFAMHRSSDGKYYAFVNTTAGSEDSPTADTTLRQFELDGSSGTVTGTAVRTLTLGSQAEGMVVDDQTGALYVAEEDVGIWRYGADPGTGSTRTQVDATGSGHLTADVEGLTIYYASNGGGYLIASSQGDSTYAVYDRSGDNAYRGSFDVGSNNGIDGVSSTDGIDVTNLPLGSAFPEGMLVVHDHSNSDGSTSNFKYIPWEDVADLGHLTIDTAPNPMTDWLM